MGPYPHTAPKSQISVDNPAGTDGFEFVEFAHPAPDTLRDLFGAMGFARVARHKTRDIELWQQGHITYVVNADPASFAARFAAAHGPSAPSMAWRVTDAQRALAHAVACGAEAYDAPDRTLDVPAIIGIGGSLIYLVDRYGGDLSPYDAEFDWLARPKPPGLGFYYLDHLTKTWCAATWTAGSSFMAICSISGRSGFSTSKANIAVCSAGR